MKNKILLIPICALLLISCKEKNNSSNSVDNKNEFKTVTQEEIPERKTIIYKDKTDSEISNIITEYENISALKWDANQIYEIKGIDNPNEIIKAFLLNGQLEKMEVTENSKGVTKVSELYFKNNYLSLVIEKEINTLDSITENHFYFKNNKLIKKVTNLQYEKTSSNEDLISEEKRVKNKCDNYAAQMMTEIKKTFENNN